MQAMLEGEAGLTDEQEALYAQLETEADELTAELAELRDEASKAERRQKAEEIRAFAKSSTRVTGPNKPGPRVGRVKAGIEDDPKKGFKSFAHFAARVFDAGSSPRHDEMLMQVAAGTGMQQSIT